MAMLFKGEATVLATVATPGVTEDIEITGLGRWYQLGTSDANPSGVRLVENVVLTDDADGVIADLGANYEVDLARARVFIPVGGAIGLGDTVTFTYDIAASSRSVIISKGDQVTGALRYIADNTTGTNTDHYWPKVDISPDGDYEFKGDDWNEMSFSGEVLTKVSASGTRMEKHYADGVAAAA